MPRQQEQTSAPSRPAEGPLAGVRILDLTRIVAGPLATQVLGDLGADVVKVERPDEGDDCRRTGPPWTASGEDKPALSTYFLAVNRNKRSIAVDYRQPSGAKLLADLASRADVLIENYRPGTLAKYGMDYETLRAGNPRLIYCSITGFGQTGPYAGRSGYDYLVQAMSGMMTVNGPANGEPTRVGVPIADISAGLYATIGILAALYRRASSGTGQFIDISLLESQIAVLLNGFSGWFNAGVALGRTGNDHPSAVPYGIYEVKDGRILIATFNDREFDRLARALDHPEWASDPRFATNGPRVAHRALLRDMVTNALRDHTVPEWIEKLNAAQVSCGPLSEIGDLEQHPQVQAREGIVELQHPTAGPIRTAASPLRLSENPTTYRHPPPLLGQHTDEVARDWLTPDSA